MVHPTLVKLNDIYNKHKEQFTGSFHTVLWHIIIGESKKGGGAAFTPIPPISPAGFSIGIANKVGGYTPTLANFVSTSYDECTDICTALNDEVFGLTEEQADMIVSKSMLNALEDKS